jgi:multisubunit Na+/H+ antiporter MnhC subunit
MACSSRATRKANKNLRATDACPSVCFFSKASRQRQTAAQGQIIAMIENALEARRQGIIICGSVVNWAQWSVIFVQAICALIAIFMLHADNRLQTAVAMALFAQGIAVSLVLITAHNRPWGGEISVSADLLLQFSRANAPAPRIAKIFGSTLVEAAMAAEFVSICPIVVSGVNRYVRATGYSDAASHLGMAT